MKLKDKFFETFPNAPKDEDGCPMEICPYHLGYTRDKCDTRKCKECWNREID